MLRGLGFLTVLAVAHDGYLHRLHDIPAFRSCTRRQLEQVARLVVTLDPVRALVVDRRAVPAVLHLAPTLGTPGSEVPLQSA